MGYNNGTLLINNFKLNLPEPLDSRMVVDTYTNLLNYPEEYKYEGSMVYCIECRAYYVWKLDNWILFPVVFKTGTTINDIHDEDLLKYDAVITEDGKVLNKFYDIILNKLTWKTVATLKTGSGGGGGGTPGPMGPRGLRGSQWYSGSNITGKNTTPIVFTSSDVSTAEINDKYINLDTGNIYECATRGTPVVATWKYIGNIRGVNGGNFIISQSVSDISTRDVDKGDIFLNSTNGKLYKAASTGKAGAITWNELSSAVAKIYQNTGRNTDGSISQKTVTEELEKRVSVDKIELSLSGNKDTSSPYKVASYNIVKDLKDQLDSPVLATDTLSGISKLYQNTGSNTDGSISQKIITDSISTKIDNNRVSSDASDEDTIDGKERVTALSLSKSLKSKIDILDTKVKALTGGGIGSLEQASETTSGIMKLYKSSGSNEDGTLTQRYLSEQLAGKLTESQITDDLDNHPTNKIIPSIKAVKLVEDKISTIGNDSIKYTNFVNSWSNITKGTGAQDLKYPNADMLKDLNSRVEMLMSKITALESIVHKYEPLLKKILE
jgi:hypothetical protein